MAVIRYQQGIWRGTSDALCSWLEVILQYGEVFEPDPDWWEVHLAFHLN